jgi:hypothetical protein
MSTTGTSFLSELNGAFHHKVFVADMFLSLSFIRATINVRQRRCETEG